MVTSPFPTGLIIKQPHHHKETNHLTGPKKLCSDGTYGINPSALNIPEVDIYSNHYYPLNITQMDQDVKLTSAANKVYYNGEIDWTGLNAGRNPGDKLADFYGYIQKTQKENSYTVGGTLIWSLFGRNVPDCSVRVPFLLVSLRREI
jgi:mannan endo-1,4-beta-mannosidase